MVAIIFVKNVRLRNGGHFKIEPPKSRGAICDQTVSLIKKVKKIDPLQNNGGLVYSIFLLDSPLVTNGHRLLGGSILKWLPFLNRTFLTKMIATIEFPVKFWVK